jgi:hypothetical protein
MFNKWIYKNNSCRNCSYYIEDIDFQNLENEQQIEFEKIDFSSLADDAEIDMEKLGFLLSGMRQNSCIGGLLKPGEIKENCRYYKNLPRSFNKEELLQSFIANSNKISNKTMRIITTVFGVLTLLASIYGIFTSSENRGLKEKIDNYITDKETLENKLRSLRAIYETDSIGITKLNDSIKILNQKLHYEQSRIN